jgi:O-antigen/teichoic acid export membrane protein
VTVEPATVPRPARWTGQQERAVLARRSAANFVGLVLANALQFLLLLILSRKLGQKDAGVFFEGFAALRLLSVFAALGLDITAIRYVAVHYARGEVAQARWAVRFSVTVSGIASILVAAATFVAAPRVAHAFGTHELVFVLRAMALGLPLVVIQAVLIGATRGTGGMRAFVYVDQVLDGLVRVGGVAAALWLGYGVRGASVAYSAVGLITVVACVVAARKMLFGPSRREPGQVRQLLRFTGNQWGGVMAGVGLLWADSLLLGIWRPPQDVAVYSIATRTVLLGMVFILPIGIALQPVISRLLAQGETSRLRMMYAFSTKWSTITGVPPLLFLAIFAAPVLQVLYHHSYSRGTWPLIVLALAQCVNAMTGPCGHIVTMSGRSDLVLLNSVAALVLNVGLNLVLIPKYGMIGAGVAWAVAIVFWNLLRLWQVWHILRMHPFFEWPPRVAVALLGFAAAALVVRLSVGSVSPRAAVAVGAIATAVLYVIALVDMGSVEGSAEWLPPSALRAARRLGRLKDRVLEGV